jgi:short-subunit dehydrogenase
MFNNIVITGASSGLGAALARSFAAPGVVLGLLGRNSERLTEVSGFCKQMGAATKTALLDIRHREQLNDWLVSFDDKYPIDLVIANAGIIAAVPKNQPDQPMSSVLDQFEINFTGVIATVNPALLRMRGRRMGTVAIISSMAAFRGIPLFPAYSASKAALKSYYEALRPTCAADNIDICIVCPSYIDTPMNNKNNSSSLLRMDADKAARIIKSGVEKKKPLLAFPYTHLLGIRLLSLLPVKLGDWILYKTMGS